MNHRVLGRTGLKVSEVSLGTVSLGTDYGLPMPGESARPEAGQAIKMIRKAADAGINLFDTAPSYGNAETLLGEALENRSDCFIATKVLPIPANSARSLRGQILASIENSLRALKRDVLDLVQIHNATIGLLQDGAILEILSQAKDVGKVRFVGASIYTDEEALAAITTTAVDVIQIAYNILDQRKAKTVMPTARRENVGVIIRSALLQGVLSRKAKYLPTELKSLKEAAEHARQALNISWEEMPTFAVRFCMDSFGVDSVLIGARTAMELDQALAALQMPPLEDAFLAGAAKLSLTEERLLNPSLWLLK